MINEDLQSLFLEGVQAMLLISVPIMMAVVVVATIVSALQAATSIKESAALYSARLIAAAVVIYLMGPFFCTTMLTLFKRLLGG